MYRNWLMTENKMNGSDSENGFNIKTMNLKRRKFLTSSVVVMAGVMLSSAGLISCSSKKPAIRIASNIWPGYEFLFLARELKYLNKDVVSLVELPSASVCLEALSAGTVEGAALTLDEVLTAQSEGLNLKVVAVLDVSMGADVILAHSGIKTLQDLKGKTVGVEKSAVGAVMLYSALEKAKLKVSDIKIKHLNLNRHRDAYLNKDVDALVTFEPIISQLSKTNPTKLFSSADIPGRIVDVIAVREEVLDSNPEAVKELVAAHFMALEKFQSTPKTMSVIMASRLKVKPNEVAELYADIELPDVSGNRGLLLGEPAKLEQSIKELAQIMTRGGLLPENIVIPKIADGRFLP